MRVEKFEFHPCECSRYDDDIAPKIKELQLDYEAKEAECKNNNELISELEKVNKMQFDLRQKQKEKIERLKAINKTLMASLEDFVNYDKSKYDEIEGCECYRDIMNKALSAIQKAKEGIKCGN